MSDLSVTVIIPAYNATATLSRAIESVLHQRRAAQQIIVIDDGSSDDLSALREHYRDNVEWYRQENGGAASARNSGIDRADGELVAFLDADDYWEPEKLARQTAVFADEPTLGFCSSDYYEEIPGESRHHATVRIGSHPRFDRVQQYRGRDAFDAACCVWTGTVIVRRDLLKGIRFSSGIEPAEDRELWIRLIQLAPSIHLSDPLATAVLVPGSLSRTQIDRDCGNMMQVIERFHRLLGPAGTLFWKRRLFRRWAAEHLGSGQPQSALQPAIRRLGLDPLSPEAWWIAGKSLVLSLPSFSRRKLT